MFTLDLHVPSMADIKATPHTPCTLFCVDPEATAETLTGCWIRSIRVSRAPRSRESQNGRGGIAPPLFKRRATAARAEATHPLPAFHFRSKRSRFITLVHAATKSWTNFSCAPAVA